MVISIKDDLAHAHERVEELNRQFDTERDPKARHAIDRTIQYWRGRADALKDLLRKAGYTVRKESK